ncbi:MAG: hypothetical protein EOO06_13360 [Chitinophagaceae bacterium]|nr:MAG: hypothetical protein EOO06_13360 [Chitinophagaceae bacterium]
MKQMSTYPEPLEAFIRQFNLQQTNGTICFDARVNYDAAAATGEFETEVEIISYPATGLYFIKLLHVDVHRLKIPSIIPYAEGAVTFEPAGQLKLYTRHEGIDYQLTLFVTDNNCRPHTLSELRRKGNN